VDIFASSLRRPQLPTGASIVVTGRLVFLKKGITIPSPDRFSVWYDQYGLPHTIRIEEETACCFGIDAEDIQQGR
jgi:hypothetical protein